ncbi:hypothetical protein HAX54_016051 [Datura stramonium]|uniref:Uncharacterized protein n=1 Tax=Datura stramonium TaxID=4076 RepID=A0ABS8UKI6_DATST|nr:hypothetical protein [Datura stramonium]
MLVAGGVLLAGGRKSRSSGGGWNLIGAEIGEEERIGAATTGSVGCRSGWLDRRGEREREGGLAGDGVFGREEREVGSFPAVERRLVGRR